MQNTPLSWLEWSDKTLTQAVQHWNHSRDSRALHAWLGSSNRNVGDIGKISPEMMQEFVQGVCAMPYEAAAAYELPMEWPLKSIEKTQILRDIMLQVPAWQYKACENLNGPNELGMKQLLYPTDEHKAILASNKYTPGTESFRIYLGMPANTHWWRNLPLWSQAEKDIQGKSNAWENLMHQVLSNPHPEQGTRLALIVLPLEALQKTRHDEDGDQALFVVPTIEQVLASNVQGKMALALWLALNCPRDAIPNPGWWVQWDEWCQKEQQPAELALATLLLARVARFDGSDGGAMLRNTLVRLASLREPPLNFSIAAMQTERKKYAHCSLDELLERAMPVQSRTLRFFEGLADTWDQLLLHYQALQQQTQPELGFEENTLGELLVS